MKIYLLPGVGCDHRLFDHIALPGHDVVKLDWPAFPEGCTVQDIAKAMVDRVEVGEEHVLVGVSLGGMVAQELAVLTRPRQVILISSWTGPAEWPPRMIWAKRLGATSLIGSFTMWFTWPVKRLLGARDRATDKLLWDMARTQTAAKIRRGIQAVMKWKGASWKGPIVRIHGDSDLVTPLRFPVDHVVKGGEHVMILTRGQEIADMLGQVIR